MSPNPFKALEEAFDRALQLDADAIQKLIAELDEKFPGYGAQLKRMLAADANTTDDLAVSVAAVANSLADQTEDPWIGRNLGAWTLTERIGDGGMGAVFLANRNDNQFSQKVAIKIMGAHMVRADSVARFRAERQILANLNHPNIASLIDGGTTETGVPYLVMEHINGAPIDTYCEAQGLGIRERLTLFQSVCRAVDYANRNLIVHRDLKPSNILVTAEGVAKVLDFGIAKLLTNDSDETIQHTGVGSRILTPEYASPEQILGEPVSIGSDVYALGVLLYRLLTGGSPYGELSAARRDIENAVLRSEPRPPSSTISTFSGSSELHEQIKKTLSGDIDTIVLKCLQKEVDRRYASARELADDIERYLSDEPILARPNSPSYVARKFLKRHRVGAVSTVAVTAGAIALVSFYTIELSGERDRAEAAAEQARASEAEAQIAAAQAEEVSGFLTNMLRSSSPHASDGNVITAVDLLEAGVEQIDTLSEQPVLQANLYRIMGYSFTEVGEFQRGLTLHEKSVDLLDQITDIDPLLLADNLFGLAEAQSSLEFGNASIENRLRVLEIREKHLGQNHADTLYAKIRLGSSLITAGRAQEAIIHLSEAIEMSKRVANATGHTPITLDSMGVGSVALSRLGRYQEAKDLNAEAIKHSESILGKLDPNTIIRVRNSAVYTRELFQLDEALYFHEEGISRGAQVWPEDSPVRTYAIRQKAITLHMLGRFDEAYELLQALEPLVISGSGEKSLRYASFLITKGDWFYYNAQFDNALSLYQQAEKVATDLNGREARAAVSARVAQARTLAQKNKLTEAAELYSEVMTLKETFSRSTYFSAVRSYATILSILGRVDEADSLFTHILQEKEDQVGTESTALAPILADFAAHERRKGELKFAVDFARRAHELAEKGLPEDNWIAAEIAGEYARVLHAAEQKTDAREIASKARIVLLETFGDTHPLVVGLVSVLAD